MRRELIGGDVVAANLVVCGGLAVIGLSFGWSTALLCLGTFVLGRFSRGG